jgi:hypothetical protein
MERNTVFKTTAISLTLSSSLNLAFATGYSDFGVTGGTSGTLTYIADWDGYHDED